MVPSYNSARVALRRRRPAEPFVRKRAMKQVEAPREQGAERYGEIVRDPQATRAHLKRVLDAPAFRRAPRMQRFLTFLVDELLAGRAEQLKEYTIAVGVFDKPVDFDPGTSAVIRVEAGRLRRLLAQYRGELGHEDRLALDVPKGSYIPAFHRIAPP